MITREDVINTIHRRPTRGIPTTWMNVMEHSHLERLAGVGAGEYVKNPEAVYLAAQKAMGVNVLDQYIPRNPLSMGSHGYERPTNTPTTGAKRIVCDGMVIDSPEAVVAHLETVVFPRIEKSIAGFKDPEGAARWLEEHEAAVQKTLGDDIVKTGYAFVGFPMFAYGTYGYENYFMAYALYPEVMERHFALQADNALLANTAFATVYEQKKLPMLNRLDFDMADSRGTLAGIRTLEKIWFPHFTRCIEPLVKAGVNLIWHCDGNLMEMVPRLIEAGVKGFQGFQYEDGMDYPKICAMKARDGDSLIIWAGVSVTRTLPFGSPRDVRDELTFLVENGPKTGLFLGVSSSVAPGVPWENMQALLDGLAHYRRGG